MLKSVILICLSDWDLAFVNINGFYKIDIGYSGLGYCTAHSLLKIVHREMFFCKKSHANSNKLQLGH